MFQLTFLGTSAGIPTKQRNVTALAIECLNPYLSGNKTLSKHNRPWILIDCGEATQHQLLKTKLSPHQLAAICITHVHGDHCYGLPGLLASLSMAGRTEPLTLIAPKAIATLLDSFSLTTELYFTYPIEFIAIETVLANKASSTSQDVQSSLDSQDSQSYAHSNQSQSDSVNKGQVKDGKVVLQFSPSHQLLIDIVSLSHRVASHAFVLTQSLSQQKLNTAKLRADGIMAGENWGLLQRGHNVTLEQGQEIESKDYVESVTVTTKMVVAGDNDNPELLIPVLDNAVLLVHEATYTDAVLDRILAKKVSAQPAFDPMHSSAGQLARFAAQVKLPNLILTHFSARYQPFDDETASTANMADIRLEVEKYYQGNGWLANDFDQFEVGEKVTKLQ